MEPNQEELEGHPDDFEEKFTREILKIEKLRTFILAGLFGVGFVMVYALVLLVPNIFPQVFFQTFKGLMFADWLVISMAAACAIELILWFRFDIIYGIVKRESFFYRLAKQWKAENKLRIFITKIIPLFRYVSAAIETSIPTVFIVVVAQFIDPPYLLISPPVFIYFVFILLSALRLDFGLCAFIGLVAGVEFIALYYLYIYQFAESLYHPLLIAPVPNIVKGCFLFIGGIITGLVTLQIKKRIVRSFQDIEEKNKILGIFGQHVSTKVVDQLLKQKKELDNEIRPVCVMFLDIRNFTNLSVNKTPEEVFSYLNSLFGFMIEIINRHQGVINKFLGDGFMAIFGAPLSDGKDSYHAVAAAMEIINKIREDSESGHILPTQVGIGIHIGNAVTGNIGSSVRKEYTVIGDVVNLASRIEQLNKQFNSQLLISEEVWKSAKETIERAELLGPVQIRGLEEPVNLYRLE